ncbi:GNAT family N-acetyltransferase [Altererythrobacter arenosus]|uniref:GNAT family N-acetyltransferase n=1 Tax=Altererythrobacter arenosus TaxID=3032592 RepID=A0ABY8G1V1_9SPHN|nr:GNAT family N-acetyltransferase [Altererythrobacter sp. CAU 1644]WFL78769.1 GNAT family N-acetyltransferase [Altererythrobacter sp. CAU 1644]
MSDTLDVTITHHVQGQGGKYVAHPAGESTTGYLEWEPGEDCDGKEVRVATHTIVPRKIGGRGIASRLVDHLIDHARRKDFLIDPQCSFVAAKFDENPDWADLRAS